jgi:cytochrome c biogenesis protein CcdA
VSDLPLGFAFSAGMVAAFNPCGFALLPAYLTVFLAADEDTPRSTPAALRRAAAVAGSVALGFAAVFGIAGLLISRTAVTVHEYTPWLTVVVGLALIPVGIAMMRGWTPKLRLPAVRRAAVTTEGEQAGVVAMFWFGVSYATVSLSCTIPAFLVSVVGTFSSGSMLDGMLVFAAYAAGMAAILVILTIAVALARVGLVRGMRRVLPYVNIGAGALAVLAGAYVAYYGYWELRTLRGGSPPDGPITLVGEWSGKVTTWVDSVGSAWVLGLAAVTIAALVLGAAVRRRRDRAMPQTPPTDTAAAGPLGP